MYWVPGSCIICGLACAYLACEAKMGVIKDWESLWTALTGRRPRFIVDLERMEKQWLNLGVWYPHPWGEVSASRARWFGGIQDYRGGTVVELAADGKHAVVIRAQRLDGEKQRVGVHLRHLIPRRYVRE